MFVFILLYYYSSDSLLCVQNCLKNAWFDVHGCLVFVPILHNAAICTCLNPEKFVFFSAVG